MYLIAIAIILHDYNKLAGIRLLDVDTGQIKDIKLTTLIQELIDSKLEIKNIDLNNNSSLYKPSITGTHGSIYKLPRLTARYEIDDEHPVIIIYKLGNEGFIISNHSGRMAKVSTKQLIDYADTHDGISNAKIIRRGNKQIISAIRGEFPTKQVSEEDSQTFKETNQRYETINAKMRLVGYPYRINTDGGLKLTDKQIEEITIAKPVKYIPNWTFKDCNKLEVVNILNTVISIGKNAFSSCSLIKEVNIEEGIEIIEKYAFSRCIRLESISLPDSLVKMGPHSFEHSGIKNINIPINLTTISEYGFSDCADLKTIKISSELKVIGKGAFINCKSLENIIIPDSVESIEASAFYGCLSLTSINIPKGLKRLGINVFEGCKRLSTQIVKEFENYNQS